ncbi:MAG: hemin-degrading factor [Saprospiraceae bacterium]|nr:hemin-degrading factor [Saprospiraceae bacterium]
METMTLKKRYEKFKANNPKMRIRNIAEALEVSEMELLEITPFDQLIYLGNNFKGILKEIESLGRVMALTRNIHAVHETKGIYGNVSFMEKAPMGIAHNDIIDLRYFLAKWSHIYAVVDTNKNRTTHSIQFFDNNGNAIHKIYTTKESNLNAYFKLIEKYKSDKKRTIAIEKNSKKETNIIEEKQDINIEAFQDDWLNMKDTHDFFGMLRKYNLNRQEAFRLAPKGTTYQVTKNSIIEMLQMVSKDQIPIMVFLANQSCLQIFSGKVKKLVEMHGWYNILDVNFNLHLKTEAIHEAWIVKKHTTDGVVSSLELFDKDGMQILYCFGKRKPGIPELETWRTVLSKLEKINH